MESFNQLLNDYVRRAGISDSELARSLGVSRQTIFRWREGLTGRPRQREDVLLMAQKLRLTPEERDKLLLAAGFRPEGGEEARREEAKRRGREEAGEYEEAEREEAERRGREEAGRRGDEEAGEYEEAGRRGREEAGRSGQDEMMTRGQGVERETVISSSSASLSPISSSPPSSPPPFPSSASPPLPSLPPASARPLSSPPLSWRPHRWGLLITGGGLLLLTLALAIGWMSQKQNDLLTTHSAEIITALLPASSPPASPLPLSSPPASSPPPSSLILITHFANYASSQVGYNVAGRLAQALQQEINRAGLEHVRLAIWPQPVGERAAALQAGQAMSATLVIYGEYDVGRVVVAFAQPADQTAFMDPALQQEVADLEELSATINGDLPQQVRSLALMTLGQIYLTQGEAERAQPLLLQARANLQNDPQVDQQTWALVHFYLGLAYQHSQPAQLEQAITAYSQASEAWPEMISSRLNRSAAYVARRQSDDLALALADAERVVAMAPDWAAAYSNRASIRLTMGGAENLALALADLDRALALDETLPAAYFNRAYIYFRQGRSMAQVAPDLQAALAWQPDYAMALNLFCWGYALEQQPELALPYCQQAVAADPQPIFLDSRGLVYALLGDYAAASADFRSYVTWLEQQPGETWQPILAERRAWLKALEAGRNPFTPTVLAELRGELGQ